MNVAIDSRNSKISALLVNQGRVFALEKTSSQIFDAVVRAAHSGFPRSLVTAAKATLDEAILNGELLSPKSAELHQLLKKTVKVPALLRPSIH